VLYAFGFERVGVVAGDMYLVIPAPLPGQEGAERGVRVEVRLLERGELRGSAYSARPIEVGRPVWRADLLEAADGPPGSLNRAHYHPAFRGWDPGRRVFDEAMTADPVRWVAGQLSDLGGLLERAGVPADDVTAADAVSLRGCLPEITAAVERLLRSVWEGELGVPPGGEPAPAPAPGTATVPAAPAAGVRAGWL
jgi:hypothetical protein